MLVVRKMVILGQQNCISGTNKIPEYAREFKNEYLFIRGINKTCEKFVKKLDVDAKIFDTPQAYQLMLHFRRFVKAKELGYLDDNSEFKFEESDINFIDSLELQLDDYFILLDRYYKFGITFENSDVYYKKNYTYLKILKKIHLLDIY